MQRRHQSSISRHNRFRTVACAGLLSLAALAGCDGQSPRDTVNSKGAATGEGVPAPVPATQPGGATQPSAAGQAPLPAIPSMLGIRRMATGPNGAPVIGNVAGSVEAGEDQPSYLYFPPARLIASADGSAVELRLFSDDPEEAINKKWVGDRFYFKFNPQFVDAGNLMKLDNATWRATASYDETEETANGVFLQGDRYHLVPVDVLIRVLGDAPNAQVRVDGIFKQFDTTDASAKAAFYEVSGVLMPKVEAGK